MRELKFRDYDMDNKTMRYFDMDGYDRQEHDAWGNIMQYTGLKDKNGVEIYEGDLLMIRADLFDTDTKGHEVVFGNYSIGRDDYGIEHQTACFCIKFNDDSGYCGIDEEVLVIGNIYQHPSLLTPKS